MLPVFFLLALNSIKLIFLCNFMPFHNPNLTVVGQRKITLQKIMGLHVCEKKGVRQVKVVSCVVVEISALVSLSYNFYIIMNFRFDSISYELR